MDQFCGSKFWDSNLTWYTEDPDLTECFQKTVLVWTPCTFLWVFLPIEAKLLYNSKTRNIPWTWLSITKFILTVALIIISVLESGKSISNFWSGAKIYDVDIYTPGIKFTTFTLALVLLIYNKKYGMRTSGVLWSFWLLFSLYGVIQFRSSLKRMNGKTEMNLDFVINTSYFAIVVLLFLLNFLIEAEPTVSEYLPVTNPSPEQKASFPSLLVFSWFTSFVWKGFRRPIEYSDLWSLNPEDSAEEVVSNFDRYWNENDQSVNTFEELTTASGETMSQMHISNAREGTTSILPPLCKAFGSIYLIGVILKIVQDILTFTSPHILGLLVDFIKDEDDPMWKGYFYTILILLTALVQTLVGTHYYNKMFIVGLRIRTALIATIYRKTLRVSSSAKQSYAVGEIVNLMSVDAQKFMNLLTSANMIWSAPLQILLALFFLWRILGVSIFVGLAVMIFFIPINGFIAKQLEKLEIKQMEYSDRRIKLINEILSGIKVLKLYAWEPPFQKQVLKIRNEEIDLFKKTAHYEACTSFFWSCAPFLVCLASFATFVLIDENNVIDSKTAFVSLSLFNLLEFPMSFLPFAINGLVQLVVSTRRINRFLNSKELDSNKIHRNQSDEKTIIIENGNFSWDSEDNKLNLQNINVKIEKCELIAVVGSVGSGKSSLISAMLGEMRKISGRVNLQGTVAYVSQQPWIQNATVKSNILFGNSLDEEFYSQVIETCALSQDLCMLPAGDQTEIGERGINLSGGQKQRIALARAVYSNSDIYLLDDPLSAVDSHVGKHIFNNVIGPCGLLKKKIRVLVTHGISHLPEVDHIITLKDGEISERGSYEELLNKRGAFANIIKQQQQQDDEHGYNDLANLNDSQDKFKKILDSEKVGLSLKNQQWAGSNQPSTSFVDRDLENKNSDQPVIGERLIEEETAEVGGVKWEVYVYFMKSVGWLVVLCAPIMCIFSELCGVGSSIWLSIWSSENDNTTNKTLETSQRDMYLSVYGALGIGRGLGSSLSTFSVSFGSLVASEKTFESLIINILRSPMSFFDTTPNGRILNRFSKDIDVIDNDLRVTLDQLLNGVMNVIGTVSVVSYSTPIFMSVIIPLGIIYYLIQRFNIATSRQLNRLESVSRSSIYSHFSESITGAHVIRAFGVQKRFIKESLSRVDLNHVSYYPTNIAERWMSIRLETTGSFVVFFAALFSVLAKDSMSPGLVGLSVSYALLITQTLSWLINVVSDLETEIVAVERIKEYSDLTQEAPWDVPDTNPDTDWPISGRIEFHNLDIRYREGLELVLEGLSLSVRAGEKVGIVGRTGAGKSSLTIALFRIVEAANGKIIIDGVDISKLGLHALRSRLTIIPQDPVLFSGTLRFNLDPASKFSDDQLWRALEQAHLKHFVQNLPNNLMHQVFEGGDNFSVGQRQLICLARALLRKTKVLILDEATAAVDLETDDLILQTIREQFRDCTILTIAHRLNTIIDSDRVVVLDKGSIVEFDPPKILLQKPKSLFYAMANDAGLNVKK